MSIQIFHPESHPIAEMVTILKNISILIKLKKNIYIYIFIGAISNSNLNNGNPSLQLQTLNQPKPQEVSFLDLPIEILDKIFSYVGYKKTAQLRVVNFIMFSYIK